MPLIPYEPFRYLEDFRRDLDRFFGSPPEHRLADLRIDLFETESELVALCELPGLRDKREINIDIRGNILELSGSINQAHEFKEEIIRRKERFTGSFQRMVTLPTKVIAEGSRAGYKNGILEIRMPKAKPETGPAQIEIDFH